MKTAFYSLMAASLLSLPAMAQSPAATPGCGNPTVLYDVSSDKGLHPAPLSKTQALVFYVEDDSISGFYKPTMRVGMDGQWVGAAQGHNYFFFYVDPGKHQLCINWQNPDVFIHKQKPPQATLEFSVEAGKTYYFLGQGDFHGVSGTSINLETMQPADGQDAIESYPLAMFHVNQ